MCVCEIYEKVFYSDDCSFTAGSQNGIEIKLMLIAMNYHTTEINVTSACPTHTKYFTFLANWWLICDFEFI